jgi:hypothetical protein
MFWVGCRGLESFLDGKRISPRWRLMISLPSFHPVYFNGHLVQYIGQLATMPSQLG